MKWERMARTVLLLGVWLAAPAAADSIDPTAVEVIAAIKANNDSYKMYALGVITGLWSANQAIRVNSKGAIKIYCPPDGLEITAEQAGNILDKYINSYAATRNLSGGAELVIAHPAAFDRR